MTGDPWSLIQKWLGWFSKQSPSLFYRPGVGGLPRPSLLLLHSLPTPQPPALLGVALSRKDLLSLPLSGAGALVPRAGASTRREECQPPWNLLLVAIPQGGCCILGEPMRGVRGALGCWSRTPFVRTQSPSWLAGCLRFSPPEYLFGWTHPLQTARPGLVCGTRPRPPPATFPRKKQPHQAPTRPRPQL